VRNTSLIGRIAALGAVVLAIVVVAVIVLSSSSSYSVKAIFQNGDQVVAGDGVEVAGATVGTVSSVDLTPNNQAQMTLTIKDSAYQPLHQGTIATVRLQSLSGLANRYIDLRMGPGGAAAIPNNGVIPTSNTVTAVDLDELFDSLNQPTLKGLQNVIRGSGSEYQGQGQKVQAALAYLNPAIAASAAQFREINRDTGRFTNTIVKTGKLVTDLSTRSSDLSGLVQHLSTVTQALANQQVALGQSIQRLPGFMRLANTTFVNLRAALTDLTPLVNVSKPVAPKLQEFLQQLRPLAVQAVPTVQNLATLICKPQQTCTPSQPGNNDLIQLTQLGVPLAGAACGTGPGAVQCLGKVLVNYKKQGFPNIPSRVRNAAFQESTISMNQSSPELAVSRPYAADLTGWFEGYSHPGVIDANGGVSRIDTVFGVQGIGTGIPGGSTGFVLNPLQQFINEFLGSSQTGGKPLLTVGQGDRCPGSQERGATWKPESGYPCNEHEVPTGP
jgi:phospholipid/cholesterol/gamma-HCH transport system substrate-binding protein